MEAMIRLANMATKGRLGNTIDGTRFPFWRGMELSAVHTLPMVGILFPPMYGSAYSRKFIMSPTFGGEFFSDGQTLAQVPRRLRDNHV